MILKTGKGLPKGNEKGGKKTLCVSGKYVCVI